MLNQLSQHSPCCPVPTCRHTLAALGPWRWPPVARGPVPRGPAGPLAEGRRPPSRAPPRPARRVHPLGRRLRPGRGPPEGPGGRGWGGSGAGAPQRRASCPDLHLWGAAPLRTCASCCWLCLVPRRGARGAPRRCTGAPCMYAVSAATCPAKGAPAAPIRPRAVAAPPRVLCAPSPRNAHASPIFRCHRFFHFISFMD